MVAAANSSSWITFGDVTADHPDGAGAYSVNTKGGKIVQWIEFEGGRVYREECDFDCDGAITTKDLLYAGMYYNYSTIEFDNLTNNKKVKISAY